MKITLSETLIVILNQVDKIILPQSNNYTIIRKKTLAADGGIGQAILPLANASLFYKREVRAHRGTACNFIFG